jgi:oxygen-independent coproporphyrinogen-3 oxidase
MTPLGLYIHIPFCVRKCLYCNFVSYSGKKHEVQRYFEALRRELEWYRQHGSLLEYCPYTLYVGGGTPSLVTEELILFFLSYCDILSFESFREVTIEVNPGTISFSQLQQLYQVGFDRISIGVQSFHDEELRTLGRIHTSEEAIACFQAARHAGFRNINLDLIFGIPDSTLATWELSLHTAISLQPEHISTYNLTIEEGMPFWEQIHQGKLSLPDEDLQFKMYTSGIATLTQAGYKHYEISNFAIPDYQSQHNQIYWRNEEYLGLGTGAHSYLKGRRYWNFSDLETYIQTCLDGYLDGHHLRGGVHLENSIFSPPTVQGEERLDPLRTMGETIIMNLRMLEGVDIAAFDSRFGHTLESLYAESIENLIALELIKIQNNHLRLTQKGIYLSNEVFQEFVNYEHQSNPQKN